MEKHDGVLLLEGTNQGEVLEFPGYRFGALYSLDEIENSIRNGKGSSLRDKGFGEVVFNTSMSGYQEILTDPSYYGEMICMTYPLIGNTGVNEEDLESSKLWCSGMLVHELCETPSNWRSKNSLNSYLERNGIPGLQGIDTRRLTRTLRSRGVVRGVILPLAERKRAEKIFDLLPAFDGRDMIREVSTREPYYWEKDAKGPLVVALDFGIKTNLLRSLGSRGCRVLVVPATTSAREILSHEPAGVFLSNGPGDPSAAPYAVETVRTLLGKVPIFGVCMGHQILSLALGGKTFKLKFGHRGGNQPVFIEKEKKVEISSHNHGYAVDPKSLPKSARATHVNLNDRTLEGLESIENKAFSVQFHPEASPGPHDSRHLFDKFVRMLK